MNEAFITPELIRWARERSGLSYAEVAKSLHVDIAQVRAWESYEQFPTFGKAQHLAHLFRVPFGYLFLSKPPSPSVPIPDFRTVSGKRPPQPSPELTDVINHVLVQQEWYREYLEQSGTTPPNLVGRFSLNDAPSEIAHDIRNTLSVEAARQSAARPSAYLTALSLSAQNSGVLVMRNGTVGADSHRPLAVKEFRGFAITDTLAPVVFINSKDAAAAQVFTLFHELAHIWIGQSGISDPDPAELPSHRFEEFCNRVAAEAMIPAGEFAAAWHSASSSDLAALAHEYKVSTLVIARRAFELQIVPRDEFFRVIQREKLAQLERRKGGGGDPYLRIIARNSKRLTTAVMSAVRENRLVYRDAARLLGVSNPTFDTMLKKRIG